MIPANRESLDDASAPVDVGVLVMSCDRYRDLWGPYFAAFFDHWPDCPFPVYLVSNELECADPRVRSLKTGPDQDWSSSIHAALGQMAHPRVLTLFEDLFLLKPVPTRRVLELCNWAQSHRAKYLRMKATPPPDEALDAHGVGRLRQNSLYRTALHAALVDRAYLLGLLRTGESAWAYEIRSPARARDEPGFYGTAAEVFEAVNGVEKGRWYPEVLSDLQQRGYVGAVVTRPVWSPAAVRWRARWARLRGLVRRALPHALRPWAHRLLWRCYRLLGKVS